MQRKGRLREQRMPFQRQDIAVRRTSMRPSRVSRLGSGLVKRRPGKAETGRPSMLVLVNLSAGDTKQIDWVKCRVSD